MWHWTVISDKRGGCAYIWIVWWCIHSTGHSICKITIFIIIKSNVCQIPIKTNDCCNQSLNEQYIKNFSLGRLKDIREKKDLLMLNQNVTRYYLVRTKKLSVLYTMAQTNIMTLINIIIFRTGNLFHRKMHSNWWDTSFSCVIESKVKITSSKYSDLLSIINFERQCIQ
jgi:hypothetical protein